MFCVYLESIFRVLGLYGAIHSSISWTIISFTSDEPDKKRNENHRCAVDRLPIMSYWVGSEVSDWFQEKLACDMRVFYLLVSPMGIWIEGSVRCARVSLVKGWRG